MAVPKSMQQKYDEIAPLIIDFCDKKMNEEYKEICLRLLEKLCRKRPSPLASGRARTWAAGIVYAIGSNNFIFDKSQEINMTATELAEPFGISASTASNKANEIKKHIKMSYFTPEWVLHRLTDNNPMTWMVEIDGLPFDVRMLPITIQQQAYSNGLIPYVPGMKDKKPDNESPDKNETSVTQNDSLIPGQAFEFMLTLDMYDFEIQRKVIIPSNITFKQLHFVIQSCFNWLSYHMYDFSVFDNSEECNQIAIITNDKETAEYAGASVKVYPLKTKLTALLPKYKRVLYTYDYGDDWRHCCELVNIVDNYTNDYPTCVEGKGDAPPDDVGGEPGFANFIAAINDSNHPDHNEMKKWGKTQKFEKFDIDKINTRLRKSLSRTR